MRALSSLSLAVALLLSGSGLAAAADLAMPLADTLAPPAANQPVEWGSGWYLRGDLGAGTLNNPDYNANLAPATKKTWSSGMGFGFKFNNWMRADTTVDFHWGGNGSATGSNITCETSIGPPVVNSTCTGTQTRSRSMINWMNNAYLDLGSWSGLTPYIGAGIGLSHQNVGGSIAYIDTATHTSYTCPTCTITTWDRTDARKSFTAFAWALMGGVTVDVSDHAKLDIGLRYQNMGKVTYTDSSTGLVSRKPLITKAVHVGMRYMID